MQEKSTDKKQAKASGDISKIQESGSTAQNDDTQDIAADAIAILKADHRRVEQLFNQFENAASRRRRAEIMQQIVKELIIHATVEEEIFYPACREVIEDDESLDEAQVEHDGVKILIADLLKYDATGQFYMAKAKVLSEYVKHHVREEEGKNDSIFAQATQAGLDGEELGRAIAARKQELENTLAVESLQPPTPVSIKVYDTEEMNMANYERSGRGNEGGGRYGREDEDRGNYGRGRGGGRSEEHEGPFRDSVGRLHREDGRFMREDEDDERRGGGGRSGGGRSGGGGRYGQDEDRYSRGRSGRQDEDEGSFRDSIGRLHREDGRFMREDEEDEGGGRYGRSGGGSRGGRQGQERYGRYEDDERRSSGSGGGRGREDDRYGGGGRGGDHEGPFRDSVGRLHREDGRFMSEDEDDRGGGRGRYGSGGGGGRGRDQDRYSSSGRGGDHDGPFRDSVGRLHREDGRFMREDDDERSGRGGGRGYSRDDDNDRRGGGSRSNY